MTPESNHRRRALESIYVKYQHMDALLSDPQFTSFESQIRRDCWLAIKAAVAPVLSRNQRLQDALIMLLAEQPQRTVRLARRTAASPWRVQTALLALVKRGLIERKDYEWGLKGFISNAEAIAAVVPAPETPRRVVSDRVELESVWHGRDPLPGSGEAKGLGATLSGSHFLKP